MARQVEQALGLWGMAVTLEQTPPSAAFMAWIQPEPTRNRKFLEEDYTAFGRSDSARWIYRGSFVGAGGSLKEGDILHCEAGRFGVTRLMDYYLGGDPIYRGGWLEPLSRGEAEQ